MLSPIAQTREEERGVCGCCGSLLLRCPSTENLQEGAQEASSASRGDAADAQAEGPGPPSQGSSQLMTEHSRETRTRLFHPSVQEALASFHWLGRPQCWRGVSGSSCLLLLLLCFPEARPTPQEEPLSPSPTHFPFGPAPAFSPTSLLPI